MQVLKLLASVYIGADQPGAAQNCIGQLRALQPHENSPADHGGRWPSHGCPARAGRQVCTGELPCLMPMKRLAKCLCWLHAHGRCSVSGVCGSRRGVRCAGGGEDDVVAAFLALQAALRGGTTEESTSAELLVLLAAPEATRDLCIGALRVPGHAGQPTSNLIRRK